MKLTSIGAAVIPLVIVGTLRACHCYKFTSGKSFLPSKAPLFHAPICKTSTGRLRSCIFSVKLPCHFFTSGAVRGRDASLTSLKKMLWLYNYSACLFFAVEKKAPGIYSSQMQLSFCANSTWQSAKRICALHAKLEEWVGWPRVNIRHERGKKLVLNVLYFHGVVHLARWQSEVLELCPAIWTNLWEVFNQQLIWHLVKEEGEENLALGAAREESKLTQIWKICQPKDCVLPAQPNKQKQQIRMGFCYDGNDGVRWGFGLQICQQWHKS